MVLCELCGDATFKKDAKCSNQKGPPCHYCTRLSKIDVKIAEAMKHVRALELERRGLVSGANGIHDPIQRLPVEITSYIFHLCGIVDRDKTRSKNSNLSATRIGLVCTRWRDISIASPNLWTTVSICPREGIRNHLLEMRMVALWFKRSRSLPLYLDISTRRMAMAWDNEANTIYMPLASLIRRHSSRWYHLNLEHAHHDFLHLLSRPGPSAEPSILRKLDFGPLESYFEQPQPLDFSMHSPVYATFNNVQLSLLAMDCSKLTCFELRRSFSYLDEFFNFLGSAPSLEECIFESLQDLATEGQLGLPLSSFRAESVYLLHRNLRILDISISAEPPDAAGHILLSTLTLPSLQDLSLHGYLEIRPRDFVAFAERSECVLRRMKLDFRYREPHFPNEDLVELLDGLGHGLEELDVGYGATRPGLTDNLFDRLAVRPSDGAQGQGSNANTLRVFLPKLRTLSYEGLPSFSWRSFEAMLWRADPRPEAYDSDPNAATSDAVALLANISLSLKYFDDSGYRFEAMDELHEEVADRLRARRTPSMRIVLRGHFDGVSLL